MRRTLLLAVGCLLIGLVTTGQVVSQSKTQPVAIQVVAAEPEVTQSLTQEIDPSLPSLQENFYAADVPVPEPEPIVPAPEPEPVQKTRVAKVVAPEPEPVEAAPPGDPGDCYGWYPAVAALWPADQVAKACVVIGRESGGNPAARNPSGASGLFQIMIPMHCGRFLAMGYQCAQWSNGVVNIDVAFAMWEESGWRPWAASGG